MTLCTKDTLEELSPAGGRLSGTQPRNEALCITGGTLLFTGVSMQLPYFKFMVQDWLSGDIQACSMETQGFFTNLIARIWRSKGKLSTTEADLAALLHISEDTVKRCLGELAKWNIIQTHDDGSIHVCFIDEQLDELSQIHESKVLAGKKGAKIKAEKKSSSATAELKQSESESESESNTETEHKTKYDVETWKTSFEVYNQQEQEAYSKLASDQTFINELIKYNPGVDIPLTLEKAHKQFWATEAAWQHKKKKRSKDINWKSTFTNTIGINKVYNSRFEQKKRSGMYD